MARQQEGKEEIRKIQKSKGMYFVSLPIELIRKLGWQTRQKLVVQKFGKGFRVKDWMPKRKR